MVEQRNQSITNLALIQFKEAIWNYYKTFGRSFDWRQTHNPYHIFVSEVMLQQTQTYRVAPKYREFITRFPTFSDLARASVKDVVATWSGLGYNRRALFLQKSAQIIEHEYNGILPNKSEILITLPGIGKATAASICAFAFNMPTIFIETNIRTVYIHHFFAGRPQVTDAEIIPLVTQTIDEQNAREWYYALMDYGVMLKQTIPNPSKRSAHYTIQSKFAGSDRQIRGMILKLLTTEILSKQQLFDSIDRQPERIEKILNQLINEGFIVPIQDRFQLKE
jgi:A/G-specific adenine glycosylase